MIEAEEKRHEAELKFRKEQEELRRKDELESIKNYIYQKKITILVLPFNL